MNRRLTVTFLLGAIIFSAVLSGPVFIASEAISAEDTVLVVNADIVTMDPKSPSAGAMAVSGGRIVAIGSESEVRAAIGDYTKFYHLEGRTIVPGFIETHDHMFMSSSQYVVTDVTPFTTPTLASALEKLHRAPYRLNLDKRPSTAHLFIANPLTGKSLSSLFSTHPPVEKRIEKLQELAMGGGNSFSV